MARKLLAGLAVLVLVGACDSKADEPDLEEERTNYLILLLESTGRTNSAAACQTAQTTALSCAGNAGLTAVYIASVQSSFGVSVSSPQGASEICTALSGAAFFAGMSNGAKVCYFDCTNSFWQTGQNQGSCTGGAYVTYASGATTTITNCFTACLSRSTFFPF
ncbi:MAG: hypothetical protein KDK35_07910 [Leptospiraceae bacterium]|nr:hypothetical protein [Leptospiraceae bacterium]